MRVRHASRMITAQRMVAIGMSGHASAFFRRHMFGAENIRLEPHSILAPSHRSDHDVPVLASLFFPYWARAFAEGKPWPTFATDDQAFMKGFLAGYTPGLPLWLRQLLWPIRVGGVLERHLQCVPVRQPSHMLAVELLRSVPDQPLDGQIPVELRAALNDRAVALRRPPPRLAADVLQGGYADLLWTEIDRDTSSADAEIWREHLRAAVGDFRRLVIALRSGGSVVLFPEGELSEDGKIGPLKSGLASLARRGRACLVQPVAISYDPLTYGRTRAYVSVAPALEPVPLRPTEVVTRALRRATVLSAGQIAAWNLVERDGSPGGLAATAESWISRALADGRPIDPGLRGPGRGSALRIAHARALGRGATDTVIVRLATELENIHSP
jgi:1-acyl-sn-glycerol-3-phosphate acyltransferase